MANIDGFTGKYFFLSNFYPCYVYYKGVLYKSSESAYQAQKCQNSNHRLYFSSLSADESKKYARSIDIVDGWECSKDKIMYDIVFAKFNQNVSLRRKLLNTGDAYLIESNDWGDVYWGVCAGVGQNRLGRILCDVRDSWKRYYDI